MTNKIIGDKSVFAIEYEERFCNGKAVYAKCAIWLGGQALTEPDSFACMNNVLASLRGVDAVEDQGEFLGKTPETPNQLLGMMQGHGLEQAEKHYFLAFEGFDDFLKLFFKGKEAITFIWALHPKVAKFDVYTASPQGVMRADVPNKYISQVVAELAKDIA